MKKEVSCLGISDEDSMSMLASNDGQGIFRWSVEKVSASPYGSLALCYHKSVTRGKADTKDTKNFHIIQCWAFMPFNAE